YLKHRIEVIVRRSTFRLNKRKDRLHLVLGLLIAIIDIDEVIQVIRSSDEAESAKTRLREIFELSDLQAEYILELRLRRLTKFSRIELEAERDQLLAEIAELETLLGSEQRIRTLVSDELLETSERYGTPRRTLLTNVASIQTPTARDLGKTQAKLSDSPCTVMLSVTGKLIRVKAEGELIAPSRRSKHDALLAAIETTNRGSLGAITNFGRLIRFTPSEAPEVLANSVQLSAGVRIREYIGLSNPKEQVLTIIAENSTVPLAMATASGVVKRWIPQDWAKQDDFTVIALKDGDHLVGASSADENDELCFVSDDAQLLHYSAGLVRAQGRAGGGIAGMNLADSAQLLQFSVLNEIEAAVVVTIATGNETLAGVEPGRGKVSKLADYPSKGRNTGGVRCQSFLKGDDILQLAWAGPSPAHAIDSQGTPKDLPAEISKRDASGTRLDAVIDAIGFSVAAIVPSSTETVELSPSNED
ncbi:MAG: DNA gyrase subunit A, partial [Microbacteriaceae bacterium]